MAQEVIAIFDIGKTNKKFFLFDAKYKVVHEEVISFEEIPDDDGFLSEDLESLVSWIKKTLFQALKNAEYKVTHVNFSTYGASLVHLDNEGNLATPFYNYLKPVSKEIQDEFFEQHGEKEQISKETASPILGMLNSGFQLYWLKKTKPESFQKIATSLHFPQYLSYIFTGKFFVEYTSLGCHTMMWDFTKKDYHDWIYSENIKDLFPQLVATGHQVTLDIEGNKIQFGVGIHDSSSALLPYLFSISEPFKVLSTGTWSISLNPYSKSPLKDEELEKDCLSFLRIDGRSVKASRLFLGKQFDDKILELNQYFDKSDEDHISIKWNKNFISKRKHKSELLLSYPHLQTERFGLICNQNQDYSIFDDFEDAFHHLIDELTDIQVASLSLINDDLKSQQIIIEGGFGNNEVFVELLKRKIPDEKIVVSKTTQGSSVGAAMVLNQNLKKY